MVLASLPDWLEAHSLPCLNKKLLGIPCPGCGFQRAVIALMRGDLAEAWEMYPAIFPILGTLLLVAITLKWKFKYRNIVLKGAFAVSVLFILVSYALKMSQLPHHP
jgi:hypothetical protein